VKATVWKQERTRVQQDRATDGQSPLHWESGSGGSLTGSVTQVPRL
jgi:hypothetical protein